MQEVYNLKIFKDLEKKHIDYILNNSKTQKYNAWDIIIKQWEKSNWNWYIIKSWEVLVEINLKEITKLSAWDIFWEIALLNEEDRVATVKSLTDLELIIISQESIFEMINNWNESINKDIMQRLEDNLKINN